MNSIYIDEINSLTTGSTINVNGKNIIDLPSAANELLVCTSINNFEWASSYNYLKTSTSNIKVDNNAPLSSDYILISSSSTNASWQQISLEFKQSVRVATNINGTLATSFENGDVIDGITLQTGDRILIRAQTDPIENGIYVVNASGAPTRSSDFANGSSANGNYIFVNYGTINSGTGFINYGGIVGTDPIIWDIFTTEMSKNSKAFINSTNNLVYAISVGIKYIKLGVGTFDIGTGIVINNSNTTIEGSGIDLTILTSTNTSNSYLININETYITIKNLTLTGNHNANNDYHSGINVNGFNFSLNNCKLLRCYNTKMININRSYCFIKDVIISSISNISSNPIIDILNGINYTNINNLSLSYTGTTVVSCINISGTNVKINNSTLISNSISFGIGIYLNSTATNIIINNSNISLFYYGIYTNSSFSDNLILSNCNLNNISTNWFGNNTIIKNNKISLFNNPIIRFQNSTQTSGWIITNNYFTVSSSDCVGIISPTGISSFSLGTFNNNYISSASFSSTTFGQLFPIEIYNSNSKLSTLNNSCISTFALINSSAQRIVLSNDLIYVNSIVSATLNFNTYTSSYSSNIAFGTAGQFNIIIGDAGVSANINIINGDMNGINTTIINAPNEIIILRNNGFGTSRYSWDI